MKTAYGIAAAAIAMAVGGTSVPVLALDLVIPGARSAAQGMTVPGASRLDLDIARSVQSRENFQFEQRIYRELDRNMNMQPVPRPYVPRVQPTCQRDIDGGNQTRACR